VFRILHDTHPDKLRSLGDNAAHAAQAIVGSLTAYNDRGGARGSSLGGGDESADGSGGGPSLDIAALEMLTDMCSATASGVSSVIAAGGINVAMSALEQQRYV
jgi:hypothetical protein